MIFLSHGHAVLLPCLIKDILILRYKFEDQPAIVKWNFAVLATCLAPLLSKSNGIEGSVSECDADAREERFEDGTEVCRSILHEFDAAYAEAMRKEMGNKLGLLSLKDGDVTLVQGHYEAFPFHESILMRMRHRQLNIHSILILPPPQAS